MRSVPPMARITVSTVIDASPDEVWAAVEDVRTHTEWMADAVAIRVTSDRTEGVGTVFECDTKVGPFGLTDVMEIKRWEPRRAMGVRHVGLVTGDGVFTLAPAGRRFRRRHATRFEWSERLVFPWWMGGPVGALVGGRVMARIWEGNLGRLKARIEGGTGA